MSLQVDPSYSRTSSTDMACAACPGRTGERPWYILHGGAMIGPLCPACAALHFPDRERSE